MTRCAVEGRESYSSPAPSSDLVAGTFVDPASHIPHQIIGQDQQGAYAGITELIARVASLGLCDYQITVGQTA